MIYLKQILIKKEINKMKYKLIEDKNGTIICNGKRYRLEKENWLCYNVFVGKTYHYVYTLSLIDSVLMI